jgi:hypothetical protein
VPTGRQWMAFSRANEDYAATLEALRERVINHSFGGDILDQPMPVLTAILVAMNKRVEESAVPPTSADG